MVRPYEQFLKKNIAIVVGAIISVKIVLFGALISTEFVLMAYRN